MALVNLFTGAPAPIAGRITRLAQDITKLAPHERTHRSIVRTFQINQLFDSLTLLQTLALTVPQHPARHRLPWSTASTPKSPPS